MLTGIRIILIILLIGGAVAFIGDYIGKSIGRKRLTIFGLRPRYTAIFITVVTGILIASTTFGILLAVSQDARTALFGLEKLQMELSDKGAELSRIVSEKDKTEKELSQKTAKIKEIDKKLLVSRKELNQAQSEILALKKTKEKLGKEVEISRKGQVLFKVGEVLLTSVIQAGPERKKLEVGLKQILSAADAYIRSFGIMTEKHLIFVPPEEFDRSVSILQKGYGENIVAVVATRNTVFGEEVPVRFEISENRRVYKSGEFLAEAEIPPGLSIPEIEQEIKKLLSTTHQIAKDAGIIPDPSGSVGSVPYSQIFALAKKIKSYQKGIRLKALAKTDIYAVGPLEVTFKIYYR
jgi:uncharacterized protein (DUF3084 family)